MRRCVLLLAMAGALSGCAAMGAPSCGSGGQPELVAEMVFGRNIGDSLGVSEADWNRFLDEEVTPRFPDGLTVMSASGQWRDTERGNVVQEPSNVLVVVLDDEGQDKPRIAEIATAYKQRFKQQGVLTMLRPACVSF
jgi:Protein of unknown function (DUF3574)